MKKKIAVTTVLGLIFEILGIVAFLFAGKLVAIMQGPEIPAFTAEFAQNLVQFPVLMFGKMDVMTFVTLGVSAVMFLLAIILLVMLIRKKHGPALAVFFAALFGTIFTFAYLTLTFVPGQNPDSAQYLIRATIGGTEYVANSKSFGVYNLFIFSIQNGAWSALIYFVSPVLFLVGFILLLAGIIRDMKLLSDLPSSIGPKVSDDEVVVIHDEDLDSEESRAAAEDALAAGGYPERHATPLPTMAAPAMQGPFLIQYINTYAPAENNNGNAPKKSAVPVEEIQGNINGEKALSADEIRKIIQDELAQKKEQPVIVNVPATPKEEAGKGVTPDDVRKILSEELGRYLATENEPEEPEETEILVEEEPAPALTKEEIRDIIAAELAKSKPAEPETKEEPVDVRAIIRDEFEAHRRELDEEAKRKAKEEEEAKAREAELEKARQEAAEAARKEAAQKAPSLTAEDIRAIVADELARKEPAKDDEDIRDVIRDVIRAELRDAAPVKEEKVPPVVVVKDPEPKQEAKPAPRPIVNIIVKKASPEPSPEPVPVKEAAPEPEPVVIEVPGPAEGEADNPNKIIRIPFPERMGMADQELRNNYNELKSEILSYGDVKSRVSNTGDTFRAHTVTFVKITIAGKGLKLYFALDPKDYAHSTLPVLDASAKSIYRDIPLVFKVKSELSMRRAKQLIADVMEKNGYEQGKIEKHDWAEDLKSYKPAGSKDDEDEDDE